MEPGSGPRPLLLPEGVVFTCQNSGACCRNDWLIGVDDVAHARLARVDWPRLDPTLGSGEKFRALAPPLPTGERLTFARRPDGACVFLAPGEKCAIHTLLGYRAKPQVCREFPYQFVETPDGVAVGVSFACTAVRAHHGRPLGEQRAEIEEVLAGSYRVRRLPEPILLFRDMDLTWAAYRPLEAALLAILGRPDVPVAQALLAGSLLIALCVSLRKVEERAAARGAPPRETMAGALAALAAADHGPVLAAAERIGPPPGARLTPLAPLYTWLQFSARPMSRAGLVLALYRNWLVFARGRGRLAGLPGGPPLDLAAVREVAFDPGRAGADAFLREYWTHVLFRKTLVPMHGVFRGYHTLLLLYAFMKWVAKARAAADRRREVRLDDVREAVRLVEQRFVLHARFAELFTLSPILTVMTDRLFERLSFPRTAVLEPAPPR